MFQVLENHNLEHLLVYIKFCCSYLKRLFVLLRLLGALIKQLLYLSSKVCLYLIDTVF